MAISMVIGAPRQGKSYYCVKKDILESLLEGRPVVTNIYGIKERVVSISKYLTKLHSKTYKKIIKEKKELIKELKSEINSLTDLEFELKEEKEKEISDYESIITYMLNPDYSPENLKEKIHFLKPESDDSDFEQRYLNSDVINFIRNFLDEESNFKNIKSEYNNAVFVIDEAKKYFSKEMVKKFDPDLKQKYNIFIAEHGHFSLKLVFIDQEFWNSIDPLITKRAINLYEVVNGENIGLPNSCNITVNRLTNPQSTTVSSAYTKIYTFHEKYDKDVFNCYRSTRKNSFSKQKINSDAIPFYKTVKFQIIKILVFFIILVFSAYYIKTNVFTIKEKDVLEVKTKTIKQKEAPNPVVSNKVVDRTIETGLNISSSNIVNPFFEKLKDSYIYCNASYIYDDFKFNTLSVYDRNNKTFKQTYKEKILNKKNYNNTTKTVMSFVASDKLDSSNIFLETNTKELVYRYNLEIVLIDDCHYKVKFKDQYIYVYPDFSDKFETSFRSETKEEE